jgi:SAM-dependent methyltransferase
MSNNLKRKLIKGLKIILWKITYPMKYIQGKYFAAADQSFKKHNSECVIPGSLEREKAIYEKYEKENSFNSAEGRYHDFIEAHPEVRSLAVDIGSGCGWLSVKLGPYFKKVISLEPSAAEVEIAKKLCPPQLQNIEYRVGFAENELKKLELSDKTLFVAGCVLSHLPDKVVAEICRIISVKTPIGSLLVFAECYGKEHHEPMWHYRTKEWWQKNLTGWEINFLNNQIGKNAYKGFQAIKTK